MPGKSIDDKTLWATTNTVKNKDVVEYYINGSHRAIQDFEKTYPQLAEEFKNIQNEQYELFASKMMDYGLSNISLGSTLEEEEDINMSLTGVWLRVNDKVNRLRNMLKRKGKNYVKDEPMMDSFIDISNYGVIAQLVLKGKWK